jgi:predicted DsbA family dithiol-disulfide isomerase
MITVYSDYICPFCFIGKQRIDKLKQEFDVNVEWRGFELHPETPPEGQTLKDMGLNPYYIANVRENVKRLGKDANLEMKSPAKISNSRAALEIAEYAKEKGKFDEYNDKVFRAYWLEERDIGNLEVLFEIAEKIGLDKNEIKEYLDSGVAAEKMAHYQEDARRFGINSVPTFLIGESKVVGAHPYEVLRKVLEESGS